MRWHQHRPTRRAASWLPRRHGRSAGGSGGAGDPKPKRNIARASQNHRITDCSGLAGTSVGHPVQPSCRSRVTYSRLHRTASRRGLKPQHPGMLRAMLAWRQPTAPAETPATASPAAGAGANPGRPLAHPQLPPCRAGDHRSLQGWGWSAVVWWWPVVGVVVASRQVRVPPSHPRQDSRTGWGAPGCWAETPPRSAQLPLGRGSASSPWEPPDPCLRCAAPHQRADGCPWFNTHHGSAELAGTQYLMLSSRSWWDSWVRTMQRV